MGLFTTFAYLTQVFEANSWAAPDLPKKEGERKVGNKQTKRDRKKKEKENRK